MSQNHCQSRRQFLFQVATGVSLAACLSTSRAIAQDAPAAPVKQDEADPVAQALGYKSDSATVDDTKYPMHQADQSCSKCAVYQGQPGDEWGGCTAFGGKLVKPTGWCMAFAKKP